MSQPLDLDAYLQRIGFEGIARPDLETLRQIVDGHTRHIPFENLDVLLDRPILLEPKDLERKLVHDRRGGYCFEQNGLLLAVLLQLGFEASPMAARVRMGVARDVLPMRTHLFLRVKLDGRDWMADVGVGGLSLTTPIRLDSAEPQDTPHETRRIVREGDAYFHQALLGADWSDVHQFGGEEMPFVDRELANWWTSTNPRSKFKQSLMCARQDGPRIRLAILNDRFVKRRDGAVEDEVILRDADHLLDVLREHFGISLPGGTRFIQPNASWPT